MCRCEWLLSLPSLPHLAALPIGRLNARDRLSIVDVIPASIELASPGAESQPVLALSRAGRRDPARACVGLFRFPEAVLAHVPEVGPFRYIVVDNDVVIVDPRDHEIGLVITQ